MTANTSTTPLESPHSCKPKFAGTQDTAKRKEVHKFAYKTRQDD